MRIAMYIFAIVVIILILTDAYVRFAPTDMARWHQPITASQNVDQANGAIRVRQAQPAAFAHVAKAMQALPRTKVLAGAVDEGLITYVTRSRLWGFPDYTTVQYSDGMLKLFGRARFGTSDLGVNAARLGDILATIEG